MAGLKRFLLGDLVRAVMAGWEVGLRKALAMTPGALEQMHHASNEFWP